MAKFNSKTASVAGKKSKRGKGRDIGKETIKAYFENGGLESLLSDIEQLEDKDKVQAKIKLIEYYMPKMRETHNTHEMKNETLNVNFSKSDSKPITSENELFNDD